MTEDNKEARRALDRLADAMAEDILAAPDDEVLADTAEIYGDPETLAAEMRCLFEDAIKMTGKTRLQAARAALAAQPQRAARVTRLDPAAARRRLDQILARHADLARNLTLAARDGTNLSDEDVLSLLDDLEELGIVPPEGDGDEP